MKNELDLQFEDGLLQPLLNVRTEWYINQHIADEFFFLKKQPREIQKLYCYIQNSSKDFIILNLAKIYDKQNKLYPTKCLDGFIDTLEKNKNLWQLTKDASILRDVLSFYQWPQNIKEAAITSNVDDFYYGFIRHIQNTKSANYFNEKLCELRAYRDKSLAHNERFDVSINSYDLVCLADFVEEVVVIFDKAFNNKLWYQKETSRLKKQCERDSFFIKHNIKLLKINKP